MKGFCIVCICFVDEQSHRMLERASSLDLFPSSGLRDKFFFWIWLARWFLLCSQSSLGNISLCI